RPFWPGIIHHCVSEAIIMRRSRHWARLLLGTALLLGACAGGSKESHAPPPVNRDLLVGKWQADEDEQLIQTWEFAPGDTFKMTLWHMPEPISGKYSWSGSGSLAMQYDLPDETKKACKEALANYRQHRQEIGKKAGGQYGGLIAESAKQYPEEQVDKED